MKKLSLLIALALSTSLIFAGCSTGTETETSATPVLDSSTGEVTTDNEVEVQESDVDIFAGTTWTLTDGTATNPETGTVTTGEKLISLIGPLNLEFTENGKVSFASDTVHNECTYTQEGNRLTIIGPSNTTITAMAQNGVITFHIGTTTLTFTQQ